MNGRGRMCVRRCFFFSAVSSPFNPPLLYRRARVHTHTRARALPTPFVLHGSRIKISCLSSHRFVFSLHGARLKKLLITLIIRGAARNNHPSPPTPQSDPLIRHGSPSAITANCRFRRPWCRLNPVFSVHVWWIHCVTSLINRRLPFIAAFRRPCSMNLMGMCDAPRCRIRVTDFNPSGIQFGQIVSLFSLFFFYNCTKKTLWCRVLIYIRSCASPRKSSERIIAFK